MNKKDLIIAVIAIAGIIIHLFLRYTNSEYLNYPLFFTIIFGGAPLVFELALKLLKKQFGSDLLAGISIVTAVFLEEYLAACLVVLMLSGGEAIEDYAVARASSVLDALAKRLPNFANKKVDEKFVEVELVNVKVGDILRILPHNIAPVDGTVMEGKGSMDESYLTGEPYLVPKAPGSAIISGALNGSTMLTIRAESQATDSRYSKIMQVVKESESKKPRIRRLAEKLGAIYTPIAVIIALAAWIISGEKLRFLSVLVVATPCPLLIAIPVAIIGAISVAAKRGIIIRDPSSLENITSCKSVMLDKTGTLTYGKPDLSGIFVSPEFNELEVLRLVASAERFSKHPLAVSIVENAKAKKLELTDVETVSELPGKGLIAEVEGKIISITNRKNSPNQSQLPPVKEGMECIALIDQKYAATFQFEDKVRQDGPEFISHLSKKHSIENIALISGDKKSEVQKLANAVGITNFHFEKSPEQKLEMVIAENKLRHTVFIGDGINDAPALQAATIGIAVGQNSDVTHEAAAVVILDSSLRKIDEFFHLSKAMRKIALQSAIGGMALSIIGMFLAAFGYLPPVAGALTQEIIDVVVVLNALRVSFLSDKLTDY